jgi:hypothetical protein
MVVYDMTKVTEIIVNLQNKFSELEKKLEERSWLDWQQWCDTVNKNITRLDAIEKWRTLAKENLEEQIKINSNLVDINKTQDMEIKHLEAKVDNLMHRLFTDQDQGCHLDILPDRFFKLEKECLERLDELEKKLEGFKTLESTIRTQWFSEYGSTCIDKDIDMGIGIKWLILKINKNKKRLDAIEEGIANTIHLEVSTRFVELDMVKTFEAMKEGQLKWKEMHEGLEAKIDDCQNECLDLSEWSTWQKTIKNQESVLREIMNQETKSLEAELKWGKGLYDIGEWNIYTKDQRWHLISKFEGYKKRLKRLRELQDKLGSEQGSDGDLCGNCGWYDVKRLTCIGTGIKQSSLFTCDNWKPTIDEPTDNCEECVFFEEGNDAISSYEYGDTVFDGYCNANKTGTYLNSTCRKFTPEKQPSQSCQKEVKCPYCNKKFEVNLNGNNNM